LIDVGVGHAGHPAGFGGHVCGAGGGGGVQKQGNVILTTDPLGIGTPESNVVSGSV